jgi:hypothetical protein
VVPAGSRDSLVAPDIDGPVRKERIEGIDAKQGALRFLQQTGERLHEKVILSAFGLCSVHRLYVRPFLHGAGLYMSVQVDAWRGRALA